MRLSRWIFGSMIAPASGGCQAETPATEVDYPAARASMSGQVTRAVRR